VTLNVILGIFACLSVVLLLWQWLAAARFPLHRRIANENFTPPVTLFKPLKGCDSATETCLRSWFAQNYGGATQFLFAVASADDPVCAVVEKLMREFPASDARLIVCGALAGANAKVSKLAELEKLAKHDVFVISDADVRVPPDFLVNAVAPFSRPSDTLSPVLNGGEGRGEGAVKVHNGADEPEFLKEVSKAGEANAVGLVNCFYRLANPTTLAMQWEAVAINADFWSQVLQSKSLKPLDFALGAVMVTRRKQLTEIGGFNALADCLADDYQLGNRIARKGFRIALCPVVAECWDSPMTWRAVWKHQLRWARTIRVCQPAPYFFSILSNPTLWPLVWLAAKPGRISLAFFLGALAVRILSSLDLQHRLTHSWAHGKFFWLAPIKDLLQALLWLGAFAGNRIEWRGRKYRLRRDGTLEIRS
jgi:ceramide glucosyltransferase